MKLVTFADEAGEKVGSLNGNRVVDLREAYTYLLLSRGKSFEEAIEVTRSGIPDNMVDFIKGGDEALRTARESEEYALRNQDFGRAVRQLRDVKLLAPIPNPPMVLNMGNAYRPFPMNGFSFKPITGVIGPDEPIVIPKEVSDFGACYEVEIGIIIGREGRRIPNDETAYDHVYGYTVYNDVTDLGKQLNGEFGPKLFDTFCPMGPCIVPKDELGDPHDLIKRAYVNGQMATERSTREMVHKIPEFVSIPSQTLTLQIGTVISTGAPHAAYIGPGDTIELEITGIGKLRNPVVAEK